MSFKCMIVDDEPLAHNVLESYIEKNDSLVLTKKIYNAADAIVYLSTHAIDILFLDIQMPSINGLELLNNLTVKPITIITTAHRDYALEGFEIGVMDYLLKPIQFERFNHAVNRVIEFLQLRELETQMSNGELMDSKKITLKTGTQTLSVPFASITHIQGLKDYSIVYTSDKKKYVIKGYLKTLRTVFSEKDFIRVHKSFIVSRTYITNIDRNKIELGDYLIPVGRIYKKKVMSLL